MPSLGRVCCTTNLSHPDDNLQKPSTRRKNRWNVRIVAVFAGDSEMTTLRTRHRLSLLSFHGCLFLSPLPDFLRVLSATLQMILCLGPSLPPDGRCEGTTFLPPAEPASDEAAQLSSTLSSPSLESPLAWEAAAPTASLASACASLSGGRTAHGLKGGELHKTYIRDGAL